MNGSYLGTEFNQDEIERELRIAGANFVTFNYKDLIDINFYDNHRQFIEFLLTKCLHLD